MQTMTMRFFHYKAILISLKKNSCINIPNSYYYTLQIFITITLFRENAIQFNKGRIIKKKTEFLICFTDNIYYVISY